MFDERTTTSSRHEIQQQEQQQQQLETSSRSDTPPQNAAGCDNGHNKPGVATKQDMPPSSSPATNAPENVAESPSALTRHGEAPHISDEQTGYGTDPILLSALRRRERELPSRVAVLDDRMTRARPTGLLAKGTAAAAVAALAVTPTTASVSVSALVSDSSPLAPVNPTTSANLNIDQPPLTRAAADGTAALLAADPHPGKPGRESVRASGFIDNISGAATNAAVTATPGRYRHGQRRRQMSVPPLLPLAVDGGETGGSTGQGGESNRERRRPWTTPYGEGVADEIEGDGRCVVRAFR